MLYHEHVSLFSNLLTEASKANSSCQSKQSVAHGVPELKRFANMAARHRVIVAMKDLFRPSMSVHSEEMSRR